MEVRSRSVGAKLTLYDREDDSAISGGSYGTVYLGLFEETKPVAVKKILRQWDKEKKGFTEVEPKLLLKLVGHPNILQYYCVEQDDDFIFVATELCAGTLEHIVRGTYNGPSVGDERKILLQVTKALAYLHENSIVHGDIKPSNILISKPYGTAVKPRMKLADFGDCREEDKRIFPTTPPERGTIGWKAPELAHNNTKECDYRADIFATGLVFGYTLSKGGKHPFGGDRYEKQNAINNKKNMCLVVEDLKFAYSTDLHVFKLIESMLDMEPSQRPTVQKVLRNNFFDSRRYDAKIQAAPPTEQLLTSNPCSKPIINGTELINQEGNKKFQNLCQTFSTFSKDFSVSTSEFNQLVTDLTIDINANNPDGWNPLHMLCANYKHDNLEELMKPLIKRGVDVNAKTPDGRNALHILFGNYKHQNLITLVEILKSKNIDMNAETDQGWKPLHYLCRNYKHENLIDLFRCIDAKVIANSSGKMSYDEMFMTPEGSNLLQILFGYYSRREDLLEGLAQFIKSNNCTNSLDDMLLLDKCPNNESLLDFIKVLVGKEDEFDWKLYKLCRRHNHEILFDLLPRTVQNMACFRAIIIELRKMCDVNFGCANELRNIAVNEE